MAAVVILFLQGSFTISFFIACVIVMLVLQVRFSGPPRRRVFPWCSSLVR